MAWHGMAMAHCGFYWLADLALLGNGDGNGNGNGRERESLCVGVRVFRMENRSFIPPLRSFPTSIYILISSSVLRCPYIAPK
jgi:hypothetical protein